MIRSIIVAVSENGVIGNNNRMPWKLRDDMKNFRELTMGHYVIMGRRTFQSIQKPLPGRSNILISRTVDSLPGIIVKRSLDEAYRYSEDRKQDEIFIIGGGEIYRQALPSADKIYYTKVAGIIEGNVLFPDLQWDQWVTIASKSYDKNDRNDYAFQIIELKRRFV